jgi:hypothetical protein
MEIALAQTQRGGSIAAAARQVKQKRPMALTEPPQQGSGGARGSDRGGQIILLLHETASIRKPAHPPGDARSGPSRSRHNYIFDRAPTCCRIPRSACAWGQNHISNAVAAVYGDRLCTLVPRPVRFLRFLAETACAPSWKCAAGTLDCGSSSYRLRRTEAKAVAAATALQDAARGGASAACLWETVSGTLFGAPGVAEGIFQSKLRHRLRHPGLRTVRPASLIEKKRVPDTISSDTISSHLRLGDYTAKLPQASMVNSPKGTSGDSGNAVLRVGRLSKMPRTHVSVIITIYPSGHFR